MKTKRTSRLLSILLSLVMVLGLLPTGLFSLTVFAHSGTGTESDPYIVTTYDDLLDKVTGNGNYYKTYIKLGADIIQEDNLTDLMITPGNRAHIVLDLNGHTLSRTCRSADLSLFDLGSAVYLTINDSSEGKTGKVSFLNTSQTYCAIFMNAGYLTINGGSYETNDRVSYIILSSSGGTEEINGGVFHYHTNGYLFYSMSPCESAITGNYPVVFITGGEFYRDPGSSSTPPKNSLTAYCPIFVTGGTFINTAENGVFVRRYDPVHSIPLIYCGGTFRPRNYNMDPFYKVPDTFSATTTIDGLEYVRNDAPVVITPGSEVDDADVSFRLLSKCMKTFREKATNPNVKDWFQKRYPRILDETYFPEIPVIRRSGRTAPELSIQYPKTIRNTMQWYQSTDGVNFTEIPNTAGNQTITPPDVAGACTMYYRCDFVSHPGVPSSDTIKVVYQTAPISNVNITGLDKPVADQPADFTADETAAYSVSNISWYDPYEGMNLAADEPAIGNRTYCGSFRLKPKDGFRFTEDTSVTVPVYNYYNLTTTLAANGDLVVTFYVWIDYFYVKEFNIINLSPPVAGQHPDFTADSSDGKLNVTSVEWVQQFDDFLTLTADDTFESGKDYQCFIYFEGNEDAGYSLGDTGLTATINGVPTENWYQISHTAGENTASVYEIYTATGTVSENTVSGVSVTPKTTTVEKGATKQFSATVSGTGSYDSTVTWTVSGGTTGTTISSAGLLSVDEHETANTLTVRATARGDSGKYDTATVTVNGAQSMPFIDVPNDAYYKNAVMWAVENGITTGTSPTTFSPNAVCTRAHAVTFLWHACGSPAPTSTSMPFNDVPEGCYYYNAVLWAVENGIVSGTSANKFSPNTNCSRSQIVTMMWRMEGSKTETANNPFSDVASNAYYAKAVMWAVVNNITAGTSATTFGPNNNCTRAQIVTFIYRDKI